MNLTIQSASSIHAIDPVDWDHLSAGRPFQSHRWYAFGEQVMADCLPVYLLAYDGNELVGRASFWLVRNEPLPDLQPALRTLAMSLLKRWPLFICRSPLSNASGLTLPVGERRAETLSALTDAVLTEAGQKGVSFALFDYLSREETHGWPSRFKSLQVDNPGTVMQNRWESLDAYLAAGNKKDRQHYKRTLRETEKLGIRVAKYGHVPDVKEALALIRNVDRRHGNAPNPWMPDMLENIGLIGGTWLEARMEERLVGCGLILEDNAAQMTTSLGLADDVPYVYLLLVYASLEAAFEKKVRLLRWGSGAYEVKQRLGFSIAQDNFLMVAGVPMLARKSLKFIKYDK